MCVITLKSSHHPDGNSLVICNSTLVCTTVADGPINYSLYVLQRTLKSSHRPDGKTDALAPTHACATANASVNYRLYVLQRPCKVPIAPMGFSHVSRLCLQGGGVYVKSGTVSFLSSTITGNRAYNVRAHAQSHRPDGIFTCFAGMLAGRRCCCLGWHGDLLIVHHHRQYSCLCACSKVPIAPMGDSHFARCLQGGGFYISSGTVSFSSCTITGNTATYVCAHAQKFPSRMPN